MRLGYDFYRRDALEVAPGLLGKHIVRQSPEKVETRWLITETEAYRGEEDLACHASKGRTVRTEMMYRNGGVLYIYLIYGMYWMMNIVTAGENDPQAVLIRGAEELDGPGKLTRKLGIDKTFNGEDLVKSGRIWVEASGRKPAYKTTPRIGIDYAGEWKNKPWRYVISGK